MAEIVESLSGLGQVYKDDQHISDVTYTLDLRGGAEAVSWGYVRIVDGKTDQFDYDDELTLHLEYYGRRVDIVVKTWDFNNGKYLVRVTRERHSRG